MIHVSAQTSYRKKELYELICDPMVYLFYFPADMTEQIIFIENDKGNIFVCVVFCIFVFKVQYQKLKETIFANYCIYSSISLVFSAQLFFAEKAPPRLILESVSKLHVLPCSAGILRIS